MGSGGSGGSGVAFNIRLIRFGEAEDRNRG